MPSLLNPWVLIGVLSLIISSYFYGHHEAYLEQQAEMGRLNAVMAEQANTARQTFEKEKQDAKNTINKLRADVSSGAVRLSIPVSSSCSSTPGATETRAELDKSVSQSLITITDDGDQAIRELNHCIDRYNQIRNVK